MAIADGSYHIVERKRLSRAQFHRWLTTTVPHKLIMEACATSNYWGRLAKHHGHEVVLLHARYVRPYVRRNKTDSADAEALLEASRNPELKPIPIKSVDQQAIQALQRIRTQWKRARVARLNEARALLLEFGVVLPKGKRDAAARLLEGIEGVPEILQPTLVQMVEQISLLQERLTGIDRQLKSWAQHDDRCQRLMTLPGIGVTTATALVAQVPDIQRFSNARAFACWLGLTPREVSSGQRRYLGRISRQGDRYLRMLLIHGARSALLAAHRRRKTPHSPTQRWAIELSTRTHHNKATVALANKMARQLWAMWTKGVDYDSDDTPALAACLTGGMQRQ